LKPQFQIFHIKFFEQVERDTLVQEHGKLFC